MTWSSSALDRRVLPLRCRQDPRGSRCSRPRCLLNLLNNCISSAVNLGHSSITEEDVRKGLYSYSIDLITEIGYEIVCSQTLKTSSMPL